MTMSARDDTTRPETLATAALTVARRCETPMLPLVVDGAGLPRIPQQLEEQNQGQRSELPSLPIDVSTPGVEVSPSGQQFRVEKAIIVAA